MWHIVAMVVSVHQVRLDSTPKSLGESEQAGVQAIATCRVECCDATLSIFSSSIVLNMMPLINVLRPPITNHGG